MAENQFSHQTFNIQEIMFKCVLSATRQYERQWVHSVLPCSVTVRNLVQVQCTMAVNPHGFPFSMLNAMVHSSISQTV